jgi:hypothetical protein
VQAAETKTGVSGIAAFKIGNWKFNYKKRELDSQLKIFNFHFAIYNSRKARNGGTTWHGI